VNLPLPVPDPWDRIRLRLRRDSPAAFRSGTDAMKPPRVSIATLMAAVMLVAVDCAAMRLLRTDKSVVAVAFSGVLPMASLLAGGVVLLVRALWRQGACHPFLVGFEAFGVAALGLYLAWYALAFDSLVAYADTLLTPLDVETPEWLYTSALSVALTW